MDADAEPVPARRPRGRPRKAEGLETRRRLLESATEVCAEWGYDGATIARITERAHVSPTALYNHFAGREELLYAAAVRGLDKITALAAQIAADVQRAPAIASAYLEPEMRSTRRLIAEIHLASARDERLAKLLADWHRAVVPTVLDRLPPSDPAPKATVKTIFMFLLGLCHFDDLPSVRVARSDVATCAERVVAFLTQMSDDG